MFSIVNPNAHSVDLAKLPLGEPVTLQSLQSYLSGLSNYEITYYVVYLDMSQRIGLPVRDRYVLEFQSLTDTAKILTARQVVGTKTYKMYTLTGLDGWSEWIEI